MINISDETFSTEVLESELPVLVVFSAPWCGPCKALSPILEGIEPEYAGRLKMVKLNIDESQTVAIDYRVRSVPTVSVFKQGQPSGSFIGVRPKASLVEWLDSHC